ADLARIAPLPNLDGHVRQGDALIDPLTLARALGGATAPIAPCGEVERLTSARRALFSLAGPAKQQALRELAGAEGALALRLFTAAVAALERRAAELVAAGKDRDLFGRRRGLRPDERALLRSSPSNRTSPTSWRAAGSISLPGTRPGYAASGCPPRCGRRWQPATPRGGRRAGPDLRIYPTSRSRSWSAPSSSRLPVEQWRSSSPQSSRPVATRSRCGGGS